jgi:uroporphyrinogen decarboxylase
MEREMQQGAMFTDAFGITWKRDGDYNMVVNHPLRGLDAVGIQKYELPNPCDPERFAQLENLISTYGSDYFIGADVSGVLFEPACHLRGMEDFMMDLVSGDEAVDIILDKLTAFSISLSLECIRRGADWIWMGDDLGSQQNMLISPDIWRQVFKPRMKHIIEKIRTVKPDIPIAYHSCGAMSPVIGDLVEIGINVLNPIQENAADMDQLSVKNLYGQKLSLMCGLDTQQFMIKASADEVFSATRKKIDQLGKNGGFIFAVSHHIQRDTPDVNIEAMLEALK